MKFEPISYGGRTIWVVGRSFCSWDIYSKQGCVRNFVHSVGELVDDAYKRIDEKHRYSEDYFQALAEANKILSEAMH